MPELALPCFTLAVFMASLLPLLVLTRPPLGDEDDDLPPGAEPVPFDHILTLDRIWHTFGPGSDPSHTPHRTYGRPAAEEPLAWATEEA